MKNKIKTKINLNNNLNLNLNLNSKIDREIKDNLIHNLIRNQILVNNQDKNFSKIKIPTLTKIAEIITRKNTETLMTEILTIEILIKEIPVIKNLI